MLGEVAPFLDPHHGVTRMVNNQRWDSNRRQNVAHVDRRVHAFQRHGGASYDAARTVWNGRIDRRPALIARCAGAADVIAAVNYAREHWTNEGENPPIGLILCAQKDDAVARYALEGLANKVVAREYLTALPKEKVLAEEIEKTRKRLESGTAGA